MDRPRERPTARPGEAPDEHESGAEVVLVAKIVREALDAYATTETADGILKRALAAAGRDGIPREPRELDRFVHDHLLVEARDRLGEDAGDAIAVRLVPLIAALERMEQRSVETLPAPAPGAEVAAPSRFATVVLAGSPQDARRLSLRVQMAVHRVVDARALVQTVEACGGAPVMIVLDCRAPNLVLRTTLRAAEPALLDGSVVALWGATQADEREWRSTFPGALVLRTDVASDVEDIAVLIRLGPE
ncbi:hypothetical protein [Sandaracinus amylolyticus]|uniref:Uncharacterized protein n=1 Tax=Sandaracinus amylolyticus TaxID=927083 RepID=A0A0F6VYZ8_9BACT|nr:hypothetical protein [Sandaracinus amylolyticus]AKF03237.1 hypothetical protein DB32_000386 [Sandaracinus amylolyticus]